MHISVESYEEMYLSNKDEKAVKYEIENIRNQIKKLKADMENPANYDAEYKSREKLQLIETYRSYLARAYARLAELCPELDFRTDEELRASKIDGASEDIAKVTLYIGAYYERKNEVRIGDVSAMLTKVTLESDVEYYDIDRSAVLGALKNIRFGEWREKYLPGDYGCSLTDPIRWQVNVEYYGDMPPMKFVGEGVYPYDFGNLLKLMDTEL